MHKINTNELAEESWSSPKVKFVGAGKQVSEALGRQPQSTDLNWRHRLADHVTMKLAGIWLA